jgi:hypothetical protein
MPSLETTHPNRDAAIPGLPRNAPFCALRGGTQPDGPLKRTRPDAKDNDAHDEANDPDLKPWT